MPGAAAVYWNVPFGTSTTPVNPTTDSTLLGQVVGNAANYGTYNFPVSVTSGNYMWIYNGNYTSSGGAQTSSCIVHALTNCSTLNLFGNNTLSNSTTPGASGNFVLSSGFLTVTSANATISFYGTAGVGNLADNTDFYMIQLPNAMN